MILTSKHLQLSLGAKEKGGTRRRVSLHCLNLFVRPLCLYSGEVRTHVRTYALAPTTWPHVMA